MLLTSHFTVNTQRLSQTHKCYLVLASHNTHKLRVPDTKQLSDKAGGKGKGKAVPLQAWSGPEGSRKLRLADYMTTAQDGGKVVSLMHRPPLPPGNAPGTHFC
jgi:hypothetical protein